MLFNYLINTVANIRWHIKISRRVGNKGVRFTAQQVMDTVLDYAKVPFKIQSYDKSKSYTKATGTSFDPKDIRRAHIRATAAATS